jgi:deazaflavin-dependent oxidoreductase (nitroreductase family)
VGEHRRRERRASLTDLLYFAGERLLIAVVAREGPGRLMRAVFRFPILLHRLRLGWLVERNVLLIETIGRRSGEPRTAAVRYMELPGTGRYRVLAGWDGRTDWYRNLLARPMVILRVGGRRVPAHGETLPAAETVGILRDQIARNRWAAGTLRSETGIRFDGSDASLAAIAEHYRGVELTPIARC